MKMTECDDNQILLATSFRCWRGQTWRRLLFNNCLRSVSFNGSLLTSRGTVSSKATECWVHYGWVCCCARHLVLGVTQAHFLHTANANLCWAMCRNASETPITDEEYVCFGIVTINLLCFFSCRACAIALLSYVTPSRHSARSANKFASKPTDRRAEDIAPHTRSGPPTHISTAGVGASFV